MGAGTMGAIRWAGRWALGIAMSIGLLALVGGVVAYFVACYWLLSQG
jgi:hypothetical protein